MHLARLPATVVLALALVLRADTAQGQSVRGLLLDAVSTRPIPRATVALIDSAGVEQLSVTTDSLGRFLLRSPVGGRFRLQVRRIGYKPATSDMIPFEAARTAQLTLELAPISAELTPITVRERSSRQWAVDGFRDRQALGKGVFIDRLDVLESDAAYFSDLFRGVAGLRVVMAGSGLQIESTRGRGCLRLFVNWLPLDGLSEGGQRNLELPPPKEVMGIEVYREFSEVPTPLRAYARTNPPDPPPLIALRSGRVQPAARPRPEPTGPVQCGLVLIWTKTSWNR